MINESKYEIFMIRIWTILAVMLCAVMGYGGMYLIISKAYEYIKTMI